MSAPTGFSPAVSDVVSLEYDKYRVISTPTSFTCLRYGEPWRDLTGDKLVGAMFSRIKELEEQLSRYGWEGVK